MAYLLSLAVNLLSVGGLVLGLIIAEGAIAVGAGVTVTALGVKINKRKKEIAARNAKAEEPEEETPAEEITAEEPVEEAPEVAAEPIEEAPEPEPVQMESYEPVTEPEQEMDKEFNKYSSTHDDDVAEIKRHLEESRKEIGQETPVPEGDGQSWDQVKDYNGAVMPIVAVAGDDEDDDDEGDDEPEPAADDELKTIIDEEGNELQLTYRRSFSAKLIQSDKILKDYYALIVSALLSYKKVKSRMSWSCESFTLGRKTIAKLVVRGKTLALYLALDPKAQDAKYFVRDCSEKKKYESVPSMIRIKSTRAVKYARELIAKMLEGVARVEEPKMDEIAYEKTSALVGKGLIKVIANGGKAVLSDDLMREIAATQDKDGHRYKVSFQAKIIRADDKVQEYYSALKNELLAFKKIKPRMSWSCETFNLGRVPKAKLTIRGKSLVMYLALDPKAYEGTKYFFRDLSDKKTYAAVPMMVKIKSDRGLKYAKELIHAALDGIVKLDKETVDYTADYQDMGQLIKGGLVKQLPQDE